MLTAYCQSWPESYVSDASFFAVHRQNRAGHQHNRRAKSRFGLVRKSHRRQKISHLCEVLGDNCRQSQQSRLDWGLRLSDCRLDSQRIERKSGRLESSSALNKVNDQDDDGNYEQEVDQAAANVADEAEKPEHDQDDNYSPEHGIPFG